MAAHDFEYDGLRVLAHRPWPLPDRPWVMTQTWHNLLFAHWPIAADALRPHVPAAFDLDVFDRQAWIAVVPFFMTNVAPRGVPALPWVSAFAELNVRTYVRIGDRPGVYFFSLDAGSALAVRAARTLFNLPYYSASMDVNAERAGVSYRSFRHGSAPPAEFSASYRPVGPSVSAPAATLEHFLTERYCLYHLDRRGRPYRLDIHHPPWSLQPAEAELRRNSMAAASGLMLPDTPPLLHFSRRQDVVAWAPQVI
jgi:uncharacterized protein YqjF (DUF2071 family)